MTGRDTRRDQIARAIYEQRYGEPWYEAYDGSGRVEALREADAVMPHLDAAVAETRAETAEAIAQAILDRAHADLHACPGWMAAEAAVGIARQHAHGTRARAKTDDSGPEDETDGCGYSLRRGGGMAV